MTCQRQSETRKMATPVELCRMNRDFATAITTKMYRLPPVSLRSLREFARQLTALDKNWKNENAITAKHPWPCRRFVWQLLEHRGKGLRIGSIMIFETGDGNNIKLKELFFDLGGT